MEISNKTAALKMEKNPIHKPYSCEIKGCVASFVKPNKLMQHMRLHTGERPFICDVEGCTKAYHINQHLKRHKKYSHTETNELIVCPVPECLAVLSNKSSLSKHIKVIHEKIRYRFICEACGEAFKTSNKLEEHSYHHTGVLPYQCEKCPLTFFTNQERYRHARTHTLYICLCDEKFERWRALLKHKKQCETCKPKCGHCGQAFKNKSILKGHLETHRQRKRFHCTKDSCSRSFFHKKNLVHHIKVRHQNMLQNMKEEKFEPESAGINVSMKLEPEDTKIMKQELKSAEEYFNDLEQFREVKQESCREKFEPESAGINVSMKEEPEDTKKVKQELKSAEEYYNDLEQFREVKQESSRVME